MEITRPPGALCMRYQLSNSTSAGTVNQALSKPSGCSAFGCAPKGQPAYHGMQPIGADDKVEAARISLLECDQDAIRMLLECGDRVVEQIADAWTSRLIQDCTKIAAEDLVGRHDAIALERVNRHLGAVPARCIDPGDATLGHGHGADLLE